MTNSGYSCVRYVFCWLNVLLWIVGCGVLGVGIWLRIAYEGYTTLLPQYAFLSADSIAIAIGVITFLHAFFGCCGSWFQSKCMLITYFSLVVFMFVTEFLTGSLAFLFRDGLGHTFREELKNGLSHHYNVTSKGPNSLVTIWDHIQSQFKCCGVQNYEDWFMIDAWPQERWVPDTCCVASFTGDNCGQTSADNWYAMGCYTQIHMWFMQRLHILGIVGLVVAFIQLFGLLSSMLMYCSLKDKRYNRAYKSYN